MRLKMQKLARTRLRMKTLLRKQTRRQKLTLTRIPQPQEAEAAEELQEGEAAEESEEAQPLDEDIDEDKNTD